MEEPRTRVGGVVVLGLALLALAALLAAWKAPAAVPSGPASVDLRVDAPDGRSLFNATGFLLPTRNATALGALLSASTVANFTVNVTYAFQGVAFVEEVAGYRNEGACGWIYSINGRNPSLSADRAIVVTGDRVRWSWGCEG